MSISALPPTAPTTLVMVLGASAWPNSPGFQASKAFTHAAHGFRDYLLDPRGFGLPAANLLDLFDAPSGASDQLEQLSSFLQQQSQVLITANRAARDVLVYFVGHGSFAGSSQDFYLMLRRTNTYSLRASGLSIDALAEVLREKARQTRRYLFLDCCFAAAAFRSFMGGPDQTAVAKTLEAFAVQARSRGFPRRGTVLLCSSDQKSSSLLLPDESCTMFSYALLDVLRKGDPHRPLQLSLRDIKELAEDRLAALPGQNAPRPSLHSPDQSEGDAADVPFFPNLRTEEERRSQTEEAEQAGLTEGERVQNIKEQPSLMLSQTLSSTTSQDVAMPPRDQDAHSSDAPSQTGSIISQKSIMFRPRAILREPKRQRSPFVIAVLILLTLIFLAGGSFGIYKALSRQAALTPTIGNSSSPTVTTSISSSTPYGGTLALDDLLRDNSKGYGWDETEGHCTFRREAYHVTTSSPNNYECNTNSPRADFSNFACQVTMKIDQGTKGGICFRFTANGQTGYCFFLDLNGQYVLEKVNFNTPLEEMLASGRSKYFLTGLGKVNQIAVRAQGNTIDLYTNGHFIRGASDNTFSHGQIGVFLVYPGFFTEAEFTDAKVWVY